MIEAGLKILGIILAGGSPAIIVILILIIGFLLWERVKLNREAHERDKRIDDIVDKYHAGNLNISDAFRELQNVMQQIKDKVMR